MTFPCFYVPLIAHAMRRGHRFPAFSAADPRFVQWIAAIAARDSPNLRFQDVVTEDGRAYARPDFQVTVQAHLESL